MATALWIKREDLVRNTAIGGNVDTDKFIQFIKIAQEIHLQNYTGTRNCTTRLAMTSLQVLWQTPTWLLLRTTCSRC
jgi:hypothetical protein